MRDGVLNENVNTISIWEGEGFYIDRRERGRPSIASPVAKIVAIRRQWQLVAGQLLTAVLEADDFLFLVVCLFVKSL